LRETEGVRRILIWLVGLVGVLIVLLILLPAEQTLGGVIKVVFLHGAILEVSLVVFAVAGLVGLISFVWRRQSLYEWLLALQKTGLMMWMLSVVMSMVATYLAWGVVIAWEEPRVQASAKILGLGVGFFLLTQWVDDERFAAAVNVLMAIAAWWLTEGAGALRHPLNPIGSSESLVFKGLYGGMLAVVAVVALQVVRWLHEVQEGA
jgi:hypothetical protein